MAQHRHSTVSRQCCHSLYSTYLKVCDWLSTDDIEACFNKLYKEALNTLLLLFLYLEPKPEQRLV